MFLDIYSDALADPECQAASTPCLLPPLTQLESDLDIFQGNLTPQYTCLAISVRLNRSKLVQKVLSSKSNTTTITFFVNKLVTVWSIIFSPYYLGVFLFLSAAGNQGRTLCTSRVWVLNFLILQSQGFHNIHCMAHLCLVISLDSKNYLTNPLMVSCRCVVDVPPFWSTRISYLLSTPPYIKLHRKNHHVSSHPSANDIQFKTFQYRYNFFSRYLLVCYHI